jgi:hypothetical protein
MAADGESPPRHQLRLEMALTSDELGRLVRHLPGYDAYEQQHGAAAGREAPDRRWRITLSNPRHRRIGLLALPLATVAIELTGYSPAEAERFIDRFHLVFRKGGG